MPTRILAVVAGLTALAVAVPAHADRWIVDQDASRLGFIARQGGDPIEGRFGQFAADIVFDPANLEASQVTVVIQMDSADTGSPDRDNALPTADWFDVAGFPEARFETTRLRSVEDDLYEAEATLTIRGFSHAVVLPFAREITGDEARAVGELALLRTDYGVGQGQWQSDSVVAHEVTVVVDLTARRAQ